MQQRFGFLFLEVVRVGEKQEMILQSRPSLSLSSFFCFAQERNLLIEQVSLRYCLTFKD